MQKKEWEQQFKWGITALLVLAMSGASYLTFQNMGMVIHFFGRMRDILAPVIYGFIMAYLFAGLYDWAFLTVKKLLMRFMKNRKLINGLCRFSATLVVFLFVALLITGLIVMVVPELYVSFVSLINTLPNNMAKTYELTRSSLRDYPELQQVYSGVYESLSTFSHSYVQETLMPNIQAFVTKLGSGLLAAALWLKNILIGLIVMLYLLNIKEKLLGEMRRAVHVVLSKDKAEDFIRECGFINIIFGGFVKGKLLDSLIIGVICFAVMYFTRMPYPIVISVIIGVTNIIPFFGPFFGAIPSFLLILMVNPMQSLYFLAFILILQQFDGNFLGPKILGDSTGLGSFSVLFSILFFGGWFGFVGMIIAVPLFAVILRLLKKHTNAVLQKKGLPMQMEYYMTLKERVQAGVVEQKLESRKEDKK